MNCYWIWTVVWYFWFGIWSRFVNNIISINLNDVWELSQSHFEKKDKIKNFTHRSKSHFSETVQVVTRSTFRNLHLCELHSTLPSEKSPKNLIGDWSHVTSHRFHSVFRVTIFCNLFYTLIRVSI